MELLATWLGSAGRTMGFSFAAGINLYATVAILGLASRYGWVALPPQFQARYRDDGVRAVADYIAGMTDRFAIREHRRLYAIEES